MLDLDGSKLLPGVRELAESLAGLTIDGRSVFNKVTASDPVSISTGGHDLPPIRVRLDMVKIVVDVYTSNEVQHVHAHLADGISSVKAMEAVTAMIRGRKKAA